MEQRFDLSFDEAMTILSEAVLREHVQRGQYTTRTEARVEDGLITGFSIIAQKQPPQRDKPE